MKPIAGVLAAGALAAAVSMSAGARAQGEEAQGGVILDTGTFWRCYLYWKPAVFSDAHGAKPDPKAGKHPYSPPPPAGWAEREFDDSSWWRAPGPFYGGYGFRQPQTLALICLRGKFEVTDPGEATDLSLSAAFRGGMVVYLNGREAARSHLPDGKIELDTTAEGYPIEAYTTPEGKAITRGWGDPEKYKDRCEMRIRRLSEIKLPAGSLKKGTNVLAVEIHRAPTRKETVGLKGSRNWTGPWNHAGCLHVQVRASSKALAPNVARPSGLQVWNADPLLAIFDVDYGDPNDRLRPIRIVGTRNGAFSGQVVVSSDQAVRGLKAEAGGLELKDGEETIPASAVQVRYALPGGGEKGAGARYTGIRGVKRYDVLAEEPPAEVPVRAKGMSRRHRGRKPVFGAVQPIWMTVNVPADAAPGEYEGRLTVTAEGLEPTAVPVRLKVCAWKLPGPREFLTHIGLVQSPDSVALQYKAPLWSEEHFKYVAESLKLLGQVGNKVAFVPLMARTNFGNEESMVRWVRQKDGTYKHAYEIMDRYLDLYEEHVGRPDIVCFYNWEPFAGGGYFGKKGKKARGVQVTVWDAAAEKAGLLESPVYGTPESETFWKPVYDELHARMRERGLGDDNLMIGIAGDSRPSKTVTDFFLKVAPYTEWVLHSHGASSRLNSARVGYLSHVWGVKFCNDPDVPDRFTKKGRWHGWNQKFRKTVFPRAGAGAINPPLHSDAPFGTYRMISEGMLICGYRGFGRVGADFWPVLAGSRGRRRSIIARYPGTSWSQLNLSTSTAAVLAPGRDGAISTVRFEMIREGSQEAEARIFIEKALVTPELRAKLGEERAKRLQDMLDLRTRLYRTACHTSWQWYAGTGWRDRSEELFSAAAEVAAALGQ